MADDYTPSINALRADYIALHTRNFDSYMTGRSLTSEQEHYGREFDAELAAIKAEAYDEGVRRTLRYAGMPADTWWRNPYTESEE